MSQHANDLAAHVTETASYQEAVKVVEEFVHETGHETLALSVSDHGKNLFLFIPGIFI